MIRNNNQQNGRRRGRGGGQGGGGGGMPQRAPGSQNYGNNRLDIRQRGNATQLLDKYKTLARDAAQQGDRVASEYYLQYADHYFRVLNEIRERQPEHQRGPRPGYDADDEDADVGNGYNPGYNASNEGAQADNDRDDQQRYDNGQRGDNGQRNDGQRQYEARDSDDRQSQERPPQERQSERPSQERGERDGRRDNGRRDDQRQARGESRGRSEYRDEPRRDGRDDNREAAQAEALPEAPDRDEPPMLAGLPGPATLSPVAAAEPASDEAPRRRRGRPRKVVDDAAADTVDA